MGDASWCSDRTLASGRATSAPDCGADSPAVDVSYGGCLSSISRRASGDHLSHAAELGSRCESDSCGLTLAHVLPVTMTSC